MISKVQICNMALASVGASSTIQSLSESGAAARQCNVWYDLSRKMTLEAFDWSFARKPATLELDTVEDPPQNWRYRYVLPLDLVAARYIENPLGPDEDPVPYELEALSTGDRKTLLTDMEDAILHYTWDLENTAMFSNYFVLALVSKLAENIAFPLTGKTSIKQDMGRQWFFYITSAPSQNANERQDRPPRDSDLIRARR